MNRTSGRTRIPATVTVGEAHIELLTENGFLLGLGAIRVRGVAIRAATVALRPDIQTPDGICYRAFRLDAVKTKGRGVVLITTAFGTQDLLGEYRDEYDSPLAWPRAKSGRIADRVEWDLQPETLRLGDTTYEGFSYALRFRSTRRSVHLITMASTWELGGRAAGNTLLYQGQVNPPVHTCTKDDSFTTTCWRKLGMAGQPDGVSFQFCSRYSPLQCCDFQWGPKGTLFGYWPDPVEVHSLVQKNADENVVFVLDKCLVPLARSATLPRKCILWAPPPAEGLAEHVARDRWLLALQHAQQSVRDAFHIAAPYVLPEAATLYRTSLDDNGKLVMWVAGKPYAPRDTLAAWAEHLPALAAAGIRRLFPEVIAESDVTENGYAYKLQDGIHGDLVSSSVCNVWRYRPAEFWGGWPAWEQFYEAGHAAGIEVGHWIGCHLSPLAPILREHPEFVCLAANTRPHAGGYAINLCSGLNWNTAGDWLLEQFAEWKRHGLDYLFFDSIGNYGLMGVDFSAQMRPNAAPLCRFIGELAKLGVRAISVEGISPVGVGRFGMSDNMRENKPACDAVAGQNDWSWWVGNEDMLVDTTPGVAPHQDRPEQELHEQCFRALANRSLLLFAENTYADQWPQVIGRMAPYYQAFNTLAPLMKQRELLPDRQGVRWRADAGDALFAYRSFDWPLPAGARVERVRGATCEPLAASDVLTTEPYTAYRIVSPAG